MDYGYKSLVSKRTLILWSISLLLMQHMFAVSLQSPEESIEFNKGFAPLFGDANILRSHDDKSVNLHLNQYTGSGFKSSDLYNHGFFSAKIKLPSTYTAGIVVAFYTTNGDVFEKTHDELDFEFLGNIKGKAWRFQTNLYGNGSTSRGREERYTLWFDPSKEFHRYSILWTPNKIIFYIDDVPIREIIHNEAMGGDYPSKPMSLYATIWDASDWATSGGRYKVNYKYAPFVAEFTDLTLHGCSVDPLQEFTTPTCNENGFTSDLANVTPKQRVAMNKFRQRYMYYSYCYDTLRYPVALPECVIDPLLREQFKDTGRLKFGGKRRSYSQRRSKNARGTSNSEIYTWEFSRFALFMIKIHLVANVVSPAKSKLIKNMKVLHYQSCMRSLAVKDGT